MYVDLDGDIHLNGARLLDDAETEVLKTQETLIAPSAVKTLNATPVEVVSAPGFGRYSIFSEALVFLDHGGTDYSAGGRDLVFKYTDGDEVSARTDGKKFEASADVLILVPKFVPSVSGSSVEAKENAAIVATVLVNDWEIGDSSLKIRVIYQVVRKVIFQAFQ